MLARLPTTALTGAKRPTAHSDARRLSKQTRGSLTAAERRIVVGSGTVPEDEERRLSQTKQVQGIDGLRNSMQVDDTSPAELTRMRVAAK